MAEFGFEHLKGPIKQVTALDATIAYSEPMEQYLLPNAAKIVDAAKQVVGAAPVPPSLWRSWTVRQRATCSRRSGAFACSRSGSRSSSARSRPMA